MKQTTTTLVTLTAVLMAVIGLNVLLYTDNRDEQESEVRGSRSTYSSRRYGTRAFFLLLRDLGYNVTQWEEPLDQLRDNPQITGLFIIGPPLPCAAEELTALEEWVKVGGYLVIADREIDGSMAGGTITLSTYPKQWRLPRVLQPTPFTAGVNHVQLTEFAQGVRAEHAPFTSHLGDQHDSVLIDFRYGRGRIVLLGEPYVLANNGIGIADNLLLSLNIVRDMPSGVIAFDEYHHGYGANLVQRGGLAGVFLNLYEYFKPTPVMGLLVQLGLVVGAWVYSRGRRFTRPIPLSEPKRRRSLEYVDALASLARRQGLRALVMENIERAARRRLTWAETSFTIPARAGRLSPGSRSRQVGPLPGRHKSDLSALACSLSDHDLLVGVRQFREVEVRRRRMN